MMRALKSRVGLTQGRGIAESTRDVWVGTVHRWASVHAAICKVIRQNHVMSEQHAECGKSKQIRDAFDLNDVIAKLRQYNPFNCQDPRLRCIVTGVAAADSDGINCDEAENFGTEIHKDLA